MPLASGARLGCYEILSPLGVGGMGEVYRAHDTKLNRDVAIKVLLPAVANDPERLARFSREAQLLASLNHPHIAHIHGLEESGGIRALVMELVEGPTLADRIAQGPIPLAEALAIAKQVADALEAAHEQGIIHRDLKPANIKVREDGTVKVLDFGLAKALDPTASAANAMNSPTLSVHATQAGLILGTAAYMSPEQARGKAVDKRADVWAFGCVLYEMLTGKRPFAGEDVTETIAAVVRGEPDWSALPPNTPEEIRLLLKRCLEKDRRARVSDIGVARFLMTETIPASAPIPSSSGKPSGRRIAAAVSLGLVAGIGLTVIAVWTVSRLRPQPAPQPVRFSIALPSGMPMMVNGIDRDIAIAPDGSHIVYRTGTLAQTRLMVRALDELEGHAISSVSQIREPFVSADGRWIGFFTPGELRKVSITGGPPIAICKASFPRGASWGEDDTIVFGTAEPGVGLLRVPAGGGEPKPLTTVETSKGESRHSFPSILPGGRGVLFTIFRGVQSEVAVLDLKTGARKMLIRGGSHAEYAETGHLVYAAAGTLRAVRFDLERMEVVSDAVPVLEQVTMAGTGEADFALSRHGTLVYVPGGLATQSLAQRSLAWVTRQGREEPINAPARPYGVARISPDGTRVALDIRDQSTDIWIWNLARQTLTPLSLDPAVDLSPIWTPDGRRVIWTAIRDGASPNLFWQAADGTGTAERLTRSSAAQIPTSISPDGTRVVFFEPRTGHDLGMFTFSDHSTEMLIRSSADTLGGEISPDGRWLAYQSNESGQAQVYVRPFPAVDAGRTQISTDGGTRPAWAHNGRELFYLDANELLTSVPVQIAGATFSAGRPAKILNARYYAGVTPRGYDLRAYDVSSDGQRFLMIKDAAPTGQAAVSGASLVVVLNWFEELKTKVPSYQR